MLEKNRLVLKFDEFLSQIWDLGDFFIDETGFDWLFEENWGSSRDQMMLGGYKYDRI